MKNSSLAGLRLSAGWNWPAGSRLLVHDPRPHTEHIRGVAFALCKGMVTAF